MKGLTPNIDKFNEVHIRKSSSSGHRAASGMVIEMNRNFGKFSVNKQSK